MAHNSCRKEIIFMGKIRWIRVCAVLVMTVAVMTACGRKNGNNMARTRAQAPHPIQPQRAAECFGIWWMMWETGSIISQMMSQARREPPRPEQMELRQRLPGQIRDPDWIRDRTEAEIRNGRKEENDPQFPCADHFFRVWR